MTREEVEIRTRKLDSVEIMRGEEIRNAAADFPQFVFEKLRAYEIAHLAGLILTARIVAQKEMIEEVKSRITKVLQ